MRSSPFYCRTDGVSKTDLFEASAFDPKEFGTGDDDRQALGTGDGNIQPIPAEEEVHSPWDVLRTRGGHGVEDDRGLQALELVHGPNLRSLWENAPECSDLGAERGNNEDIADYMGYFELSGNYSWGQHGHPEVGLLLRNNLLFHRDNRSAVEFHASWEVLVGIRPFIQYFHGFGESLLDYNKRANRVTAGFQLTY